MLTKSTIALAVIVALSSDALAAPKHSLSVDDLCRQTEPITQPAKHSICNTKDFMQW